MNILEWILTPIRVYQQAKHELFLLRGENRVKLAHLNSEIMSGKITGAELDAVTECLVNIKKKETDRLKGGSK